MKFVTDDLMTPSGIYGESRKTVPAASETDSPTGAVITVGNFDGFHRGHMALLREADAMERKAREEGNRLFRQLLTFSPHPEQFFGKSDFRLIYTAEEKKRLAESIGLTDVMTVADFAALSEMEPESFVRDILLERYKAAGVVVGYDFRFGRRGRGDAGLLEALCRERGIPCHVIPKVTRDGETVSSTAIKEMLAAGKLEEAADWMDHPFFVTGAVVNGKHVGRKLETPTLNVPWPEEKMKPAEGVYVSRTRTPFGVYPGITNLGTNPTFGGESYRSETFLFDFSGDLYGETVSVELLTGIRPEQRFESPQALREQLARDIQKAKAYFECAK